MKIILPLILPAVFIFYLTSTSAQQPVDIIWETDANASVVTFSPDGLTMYTGGLEFQNPYSYGNIRKWDVPSRNLLLTITTVGSDMLGFTNDIAVSPDGNQFASGHGDIYCIPPSGGCINFGMGFYVLNSNGGSPNFFIPNLDGLVMGVSYSHNGNYIAMGMRRTNTPQINVFRTSDYQLVYSYTSSNTGYFSLSFSPTQNILAAGKFEGQINLWDVDNNQLTNTLMHGNYTDGGYPTSLAFSPDGTLLASAGDGYNTTIKVWNVQNGNVVFTLEGVYIGSADVAFSPNGEYIAAGFNEYVWGGGYRGFIRIWRVSDGILVKEYLDNSAVGNGAVVSSIAFSAVGDNWFAYTYNDQIKFAQTDLQFISPVPVELISFIAQTFDNSVELTWQTVTESNNKGFELERNIFGGNNWQVVGFVEGKGTTTEKQNYELIDKNLTTGKYLYRIKQINFDGSFEYSGEIEAEIVSPADFVLHRNYPNPFNPTTKIKYSIPISEFVTLKIYDVLGNEVATLVNEEQPAGTYEVKFSADELTSGIYFYKLQVGNFVETKKMILLR